MGHSNPCGETPLSLVGRPWEAATLPPHLRSQLGPSLGVPAVQLQCNVTPLHSGGATRDHLGKKGTKPKLLFTLISRCHGGSVPETAGRWREQAVSSGHGAACTALAHV